MSILVTLDFDGTVAEQRDGWGLLNSLFGTTARGDVLTAQYEKGEIDFAQWCLGHVEAWEERHVTRQDIEGIANALKLTVGADALLQYLHDSDEIAFGFISGGLTDLMQSVEQYDSVFQEGNQLRYDEDRKVTGVDAGVGPNSKGDIITERAANLEISLENVIHIGDSHTDTEAFDVVGCSILFCPDDRIDPSYRNSVDILIEDRDLRHILPELESCTSSRKK